ncbi:MAG TPA: HupE/UreJ family protein, partial [Candidatus Acidoferrales bacterium]|nr:HupE/UreJ family protein [Candidatus Acidoferrales bacterium]
MRPTITSLLTAAAILVSGCPALAHTPILSSALVAIDPDGRFTLDLTFDLPPFVLNLTPQAATDDAMNAWLNSPTNSLAASLLAAESRFFGEFAVETDHGRASLGKITFPAVQDLERYQESVPVVKLPVMQMLSVDGQLPAQAHSVSFRFPKVLGVVVVTVARPSQDPASLVANPGELTFAVPLELAGVAAHPPNNQPTAEPGRWSVARQYLLLGFHHIVPEGTDHILFVLGLFLLSCRIKPLLWQVTAFTVAHSITLGLAMYGVIRLPSSVVEPLIAASITFVAAENICTSQLKPWRPVVVFCFGLIHGLGFSSVLLELGLPRQDFATALVSFNCGVELGQLAVIAAAFCVVGWWRKQTWYRQGIVIPGSALIAATG